MRTIEVDAERLEIAVVQFDVGERMRHALTADHGEALVLPVHRFPRQSVFC